MKDRQIKHKIIIIGIAILIGIVTLFTGLYRYKSTINPAHVFICDSKSQKSEFDNWISKEADVDWVPTFIIIKNKKIIGTLFDNSKDGVLDVNEFSHNLAILEKTPRMNLDLPDYKITNINNESKSLKDIVTTNDLYILEIAWIDCPDCKNQDKYNKKIFAKYSTKNIYIYYNNSYRDDVVDKYLNN